MKDIIGFAVVAVFALVFMFVRIGAVRLVATFIFAIFGALAAVLAIQRFWMPSASFTMLACIWTLIAGMGGTIMFYQTEPAQKTSRLRH